MRHIGALVIILALACDVSPNDTRQPLPVPEDTGGPSHDCSPLEPFSCHVGEVCAPSGEVYTCQASAGITKGLSCELDSDCAHGLLCVWNGAAGTVGWEQCSAACSTLTGSGCDVGICAELADPASLDLGVGYCYGA